VTVTAVDTLVWAAGAVVLAAVVLLLALLAPWRSVRDETPLPPDVEARLLLGEDPDRVASDVDATGPGPAAPSASPGTGDPGDLTDLSDLSDPTDPTTPPEDGDPDDGATGSTGSTGLAGTAPAS